MIKRTERTPHRAARRTEMGEKMRKEIGRRRAGLLCMLLCLILAAGCLAEVPGTVGISALPAGAVSENDDVPTEEEPLEPLSIPAEEALETSTPSVEEVPANHMTEAGVSETEAAAEAAPSSGETFTFSFIGDCTVGGDVTDGYSTESGYTRFIRQKGLDYPFSAVADMFARDDLTVASCEGVLSDKKGLSAVKQKMNLIGPPEFAEVFALGNVDVCNLANNHGKDFRGKGQQNTAENLARYGVGSFYDEHTWSTTVKGVKVGFVGYTYPMNDAKLKKYVQGMEQLRAEGCTFVVASAHWGRETYYYLDANQAYGRKLIDAGFDMVFGHGSHTCQMIRYYKNKVILYGMSNFTFGANSSPKDADTAVVQVVYDIHPDGSMTARELFCYPFKMHQDHDFRPCPIEDEEGKQRVWAKMYYNNYPKPKNKAPYPSLPESFLTTGYADLTAPELQNQE